MVAFLSLYLKYCLLRQAMVEVSFCTLLLCLQNLSTYIFIKTDLSHSILECLERKKTYQSIQQYGNIEKSESTNIRTF